jgi:hypothetical protein
MEAATAKALSFVITLGPLIQTVGFGLGLV